MNIYDLDVSVVVKLGSILVHIDEGLTAEGHPFDFETIRSLLADRDIQALLKFLDRDGLLPLRRDGIRYHKRPQIDD
jgi:hypothetical protein